MTYPFQCLSSQARRRRWSQRYSFTIEAEANGYHLLQGVDEVLQVNVISVGSNVDEEELIDPLPELTLENYCQNCHSQLQNEDESDQTRKLRETNVSPRIL